MNTTTLAAGAAAAMAGSLLMAGPASGADDIPNRQAWADRYMRIVCPSNEITDRVTARWRRDWPGRHALGEPVPKSMRKVYRRAARVYGRGAVKFARADWPDAIANPADRLTRGYYSIADYYRLRADSRRITRRWIKRPYSMGNAATLMRMRLELPPRGQGCGKYV